MSDESKTKRIPIQAAKDIAAKYGQGQVIIATWDAKTGLTHVVTYGVTTADCEQAAKGGNLIKRALGWPEEMCQAEPARARRKHERQAGIIGPAVRS